MSLGSSDCYLLLRLLFVILTAQLDDTTCLEGCPIVICYCDSYMFVILSAQLDDTTHVSLVSFYCYLLLRLLFVILTAQMDDTTCL